MILPRQFCLRRRGTRRHLRRASSWPWPRPCRRTTSASFRYVRWFHRRTGKNVLRVKTLLFKKGGSFMFWNNLVIKRPQENPNRRKRPRPWSQLTTPILLLKGLLVPEKDKSPLLFLRNVARVFTWSCPANIPPNMTKSAPAPMAFATSPGQVQPPSYKEKWLFLWICRWL